MCSSDLDQKIEKKMDKHTFSTRIKIDPESGWEVIYLIYNDENPRLSKKVGIVPKAGSNLFSYLFGENELLWQAPSIREVQKRESGVPILYPTPNRVRNSEFSFRGQKFKFTPNWKKHFLHGLVHGAPWKFEQPSADADSARLKTYLDFNQGSELFALWPFIHRISMEYELDMQGVKITFAIENKDKRAIPFGFALHPFFNYPGEKSQTVMTVPTKAHMQAEGLLPTGVLQNLHGQDFDLNTPRPLSTLYLDDVYWGCEPEHPAVYEARDAGIKLILMASEEFTHVVVYTEQPDFFCIENQTCSTDAHNLYARGLERESHLLICEAGEKMSMWIKYVPERM